MSSPSSPHRFVAARRTAGLLPLLAVLVAALAACGSSSKAASSANVNAANAANAATAASTPATTVPPTDVPAGTTLKVAQQFEASQLPIQLSGTTAIPSTLTIDWSNFTGGPQVVQALEANAIDVGLVGDVPLAYIAAAGKGLVAIAATKTPGKSSGIVTAPGENINSVADLKGKKVAYTQSTAPQGFLLRTLQQAGLSKSDVHLVNIASQSEVNAALTSHSIDAAATTEPLITKYLSKNPTAKELAKSSAPDTTSGISYLVSTQAALSNPAKEAAIADFLKASVAAQTWINNNEAEWVQQYYVGKQQITTALGQKVYSLTDPANYVPIDSSVTSAQQTIIDALAANGFLPAGLKASTELDGRFNSVITAAEAGT